MDVLEEEGQGLEMEWNGTGMGSDERVVRETTDADADATQSCIPSSF